MDPEHYTREAPLARTCAIFGGKLQREPQRNAEMFASDALYVTLLGAGGKGEEREQPTTSAIGTFRVGRKKCLEVR